MTLRDNCQHETFHADVRVNRFAEHHGKVLHVDIEIACVSCGAPARFVGLAHGLSFYRPTMSLDRLTLCAPATMGMREMPQDLPDLHVLLPNAETLQ